MANSIGLASKYLKVLDKVFKLGAMTSDLDVAPALVKAAEEAGTFYVQTLALVGLGDYSKTLGPPVGDVTAAWVAHTYDEDRARKFAVDAVDDIEADCDLLDNGVADLSCAQVVGRGTFELISEAQPAETPGSPSPARARRWDCWPFW